MVGVPRSKGCRICVQRRVRCDLTRPTCNNCKKGNRPCPGYDSDLKFQDEGERLRKRFAKKEQKDPETAPAVSAFDSVTTSSSSGSTDSTPLLNIEDLGREPPDPPEQLVLVPHRNTFFAFLEAQKNFQTLDLADISLGSGRWGDDGHTIDFDDPDHLVKIDSILLSPSLVQQQLLHQLHASLTPSSQSTALPPQLRNHGRWLSYLPPLTGRNRLLDTAVRAVSLAHLARLHTSDVLLNESRPYYGKAIRLLNSALSDEDAGMASETLSATILLSFYEMFASDSNEAWIRHAGGAGALMRMRGPERHRYGFDREIFLAFRHTVVIESFEKDEHCFLSESEWRALSRDVHEDIRSSGINADQMELFDLTEEFYEEMLLLPAILSDSKHFKDAFEKSRDQFRNMADYKNNLIQRCYQSRAGLKGFYAKFRVCLVKLGYDLRSVVSQDPVVPIYYNYSNVFVASTCTGLWTVLIILNFILLELERSNPGKVALYKVENRDCGFEICRSTSYLLTSSFLGPFFLIHGLRTCLLAFEQPDERDWVISKLFEIGQTHMAMASHIPGFHPGDGMPRVRAVLGGLGGLPTLDDIKLR